MGRNSHASAPSSLPRASTAQALRNHELKKDLGRSMSFGSFGNRRKSGLSPSKVSVRSADNIDGAAVDVPPRVRHFCSPTPAPSSSASAAVSTPSAASNASASCPPPLHPPPQAQHQPPPQAQLQPPNLSQPKSPTPPPLTPNPLNKDAGKLRWKKGKFLGAGAWGKVMLGLNQDTGQLMAVKAIEFSAKDANIASRLTALQQEIRVMKTLQHENIVQYLCTERVGSVVNIFMEFVPGGSIAGLLKQFGPLSEVTVINYAHQILTALEYLHRNNVVHRDVKGANVLLTVGGVCKLSDFGTATFILDINKNTGVKEDEEMIGTPAWMAPEVINGCGGGRPCDVWSMGCTVMEMFTAEPPFAYITTQTFKLMKIIGGEAPLQELPSYWGEELIRFLTPCFNKVAEDRPTCIALLGHSYLLLTSTDSDESDLSALSPQMSLNSTPPVLRGIKSEQAMSPAPSGIHSPLVVHPRTSMHIPEGFEHRDSQSHVSHHSHFSAHSFGHSTVFENSVVETSYAPSPANSSRGKRKTRKYPSNDRASMLSSVSGASSFTTTRSRKSMGSRRIAASKLGTIENVVPQEETQQITRHLVGSCLSLINILPEVEHSVQEDFNETELVNGIAFTVEATDDQVVSRVDVNDLPVAVHIDPPENPVKAPDSPTVIKVRTLGSTTSFKDLLRTHKKRIVIGTLVVLIIVLVIVIVNNNL